MASRYQGFSRERSSSQLGATPELELTVKLGKCEWALLPVKDLAELWVYEIPLDVHAVASCNRAFVTGCARCTLHCPSSRLSGSVRRTSGFTGTTHRTTKNVHLQSPSWSLGDLEPNRFTAPMGFVDPPQDRRQSIAAWLPPSWICVGFLLYENFATTSTSDKRPKLGKQRLMPATSTPGPTIDENLQRRVEKGSFFHCNTTLVVIKWFILVGTTQINNELDYISHPSLQK
ncbi:hypothetical protein BC629DRAFT_1436474 [Irpex lacteus]|nr:hypothetical protein BC629DRAFT_1436474 [Irpex lacteus]